MSFLLLFLWSRAAKITKKKCGKETQNVREPVAFASGLTGYISSAVDCLHFVSMYMVIFNQSRLGRIHNSTDEAAMHFAIQGCTLETPHTLK